MAFEHTSGLPDAHDRVGETPTNRARLVFPARNLVQAAELNEMQSIIEQRGRRVSNMVAKDGDRQSGGNIILTAGSTSITADLAAGSVYAKGDIRPVAAATITGLPLTGEIQVGIKLVRTLVTSVEDPTLLGLVPGTLSEGEPGAAREVETATWALLNDTQPGQFYAVYTIKDGAIIDNGTPPTLSGVNAAIGEYDLNAHGNYIVYGCEVTAIGKNGSNQIFSISAGRYNCLGFARLREMAIRHSQAEDPALELISTEPHTFTAVTGGQTTITVNRPAIADVLSAVVPKRVTETVTRGTVAGGQDALQHSSVVAIESIVQGGTTFAGTVYALAGDNVSWAPTGAEPVSGSTYSVTYIYNAAVTPDEVTPTTVKVTGGVQGRTAFVTYHSKLPRIDLLCMDAEGRPTYVKGISSRTNQLPPITPGNLTKLAEIHNDWLNVPTVVNNGTRRYTFDQIVRKFEVLDQVLEQMGRILSENEVAARTGAARGRIFTDDFRDDFYRDAGAAQGLATNRGVLMLAIDPVQVVALNTSVIMLAYVEEIIVQQLLQTAASRINPFQNFTVMPGELRLEPAVDFWTATETEWTSEETREFLASPSMPPGTTTIIERTSSRQVAARWLRSIPLSITINGFGANENLATLTLGGVSIKPAGTQTANSTGVIGLNVTIPVNTIPTGQHRVRATGAAGSYAETVFVGNGTIEITTMRRVHLVTVNAPAPSPPQSSIGSQVSNVVVDGGASGGQFDGGGSGGGGGSDPLAQSFMLTEGRHIMGVDFKVTTIGNQANGIRLNIGPTSNNYPSNEVWGDDFVSLAGKSAGDIINSRVTFPVYYDPTKLYAFKLLTADADHEIAIARQGDVDPATQQRVAAQPYVTGNLFEASNNYSWSLLTGQSAWFRLIAAKFTANTRTVNLWTGAVTNISDILIRATVDLPSAECSCIFEIVRADGSVIQMLPGGTYAFTDFITETLTVRAVLKGTEKLSPILYPGAAVIFSRMRTSDSYITRSFEMAGNDSKVNALFFSKLPAGSSVSVSVDDNDGDWQALTTTSSRVVGDGWTEAEYQKPAFSAVSGRLKITLNGTPAARPYLAQLRGWTE